MTVADILNELEPLGTESYRKVMRNHGVPEPVFGVKIEHMKKIQKRIKKDYQLALDLFDSGIYDAQYLAGLIADDARMTKKDLKRWLAGATCPAIVEYTVSWVTTESPHGLELARAWIESKDENTASAGWSVFSGLVAITDDDELDLVELKKLLQRVRKTIHDQPSRVRYWMNCFIIAVGTYVKSLTDAALQAAEKVGTVSVDMGNTDCKVPPAVQYIEKVKQRGTIGEKAEDGEVLSFLAPSAVTKRALTVRVPVNKRR